VRLSWSSHTELAKADPILNAHTTPLPGRADVREENRSSESADEIAVLLGTSELAPATMTGDRSVTLCLIDDRLFQASPGPFCLALLKRDWTRERS
jgi:hypothetical protein